MESESAITSTIEVSGSQGFGRNLRDRNTLQLPDRYRDQEEETKQDIKRLQRKQTGKKIQLPNV